MDQGSHPSARENGGGQKLSSPGGIAPTAIGRVLEPGLSTEIVDKRRAPGTVFFM
jgi:hypothetical protein